MKRFDFRIDKFQENKIFLPIRCKADVISLWMNAIKLMLAYVPVPEDQTKGNVALIVSKMSRIFFAAENKIFSLNFPFFISEDESGLIFSTVHCPSVDNRITSEILSLLHTEGVLAEADVLSFAEPIVDSCGIDANVWEFFRDLMLCEDGYVRYDHDPSRQNGHIHPLDHLDVFYSTASTFKIGCGNRISLSGLTDMLDLRTDCHYVSPVRPAR
ncbi:MAG: hypothetical protein HGA75_04715 [Thiobacillus sp.]|nr:hypothetical protein [Thiobacillus sp.]